VLRLLIGKDVPLNEGMMSAVELRIPTGSMLNPHFVEDASQCPAVVGGNTETSQRIVDALIKALGLAACSQGTMNNVLFGNDRFGYYETICGGAGATNQIPGADAVHTHMTNTRITDPEIIEHRYPVRLERFATRRGSGGAGACRGGEPGAAGRQVVIRASGEVVPLQSIDACEMKSGDRLVIETPGGGGFGRNE
jgi:5-oxoprolinase (ATP-hydrolysing)